MLGTGGDTRHQQRALAQRQHFHGAVVAGHGHHGAGIADEGQWFGHEREQLKLGPGIGQGLQPLARLGRHHRAGEDDAAPAAGQRCPGEGFGHGQPVLATTHHAQGIGGIGCFGHGPVRGGAPRVALRFPALVRVQIAHRRDLDALEPVQTVGGDGVVDPGVTIDPDGVEAPSQDVGILLAFPLPGHGLGGVDDVAQTQHDVRAPCPHGRQDRVQLGQCTARHVVDDQQLGRKGRECGQNGLAAQRNKLFQRHVQRAGGIVAIRPLAISGQGDAVDAWRQRKGAGFADAGDQQDLSRQRRLDEGLGNQRVAADVTQAHGVMGIEGDAGTHGRGRGAGLFCHACIVPHSR